MDFVAHVLATADRPAYPGSFGNFSLIPGAGFVLRLLGGNPRAKAPAEVSHAHDEQRQTLCSEPHEFGPVRVHDFRWLDEGYYDGVQRALEECGFRCFGDVENLSVSAVFPKIRSAIREFVSDDAVIAASAWQIKIRGWLAAWNADVRVVELQTGFSDETFLTTTNHPEPERGGDVERIERIHVPAGTEVRRQVALHRSRVAAILGERPWIAAVPVRNHRELRRSSERVHSMRCECGGYCAPATAPAWRECETRLSA
ncbi:MAG: hypothetical protein ABMA01_07775 [Chthoniobacteraceae bacterium]